MRRPWWERSFAALFALWFALSLAEPAALHSCPVHGGGLVVADAATPAPDAAHAHAGHADPGPSDQQQHHGCTCLGDCSVGGAASGLPSASARIASVATRPVRVALPPATPSVATGAPHTLPFANGPPLA
jgi:hypothetical protein